VRVVRGCDVKDCRSGEEEISAKERVSGFGWDAEERAMMISRAGSPEMDKYLKVRNKLLNKSPWFIFNLV
jgi:hypothetical protein